MRATDRSGPLFRRAVVTALLLAPAAAPLSIARADVPSTITEAGHLFDVSGRTPLTGRHTLTFRLYPFDTALASEVIWTESFTVDLLDGRYNLRLGNQTPLASALRDNAEVWLGVQVDTDSEMQPRFQFQSVPYALLARDVQGPINPSALAINGVAVIDSTGRWVGLPTGLVGPRGAAGPAGVAGPAGPDGPAGIAGPAGSVGPPGPAGPVGPMGLTGSPGAQGPVGLTGQPGIQGRPGIDGLRGLQGEQGDRGEQGLPGPIGNATPVTKTSTLALSAGTTTVVAFAVPTGTYLIRGIVSNLTRLPIAPGGNNDFDVSCSLFIGDEGISGDFDFLSSASGPNGSEVRHGTAWGIVANSADRIAIQCDNDSREPRTASARLEAIEVSNVVVATTAP